MERSNTELLADMRKAYQADDVEKGNELAKEILENTDKNDGMACAAIVTVFKEAVEKGQYEIAVEQMVENGWDFDRTFPDGKTLLHYAVDKALVMYKMKKMELKELFERIARTNAGFDTQDSSGCNALTYFMTAGYRGEGETDESCIAHIAEYVDKKAFAQKDNRGIPTLHYALLTDNRQVLKIAAERGCDLNVQTEEGVTLLHLAMAMRDTETIELLLAQGASQTLVDKKGRNPLHYYFLKISPPRQIIRRRRYGEEEGKLSFSVFRQNVLEALQLDSLMNQIDEDGHPPFYYMAEEEEYIIAEWFLQKGAYDSMIASDREEFQTRFENASEEYQDFGRNMFMKMKLREQEEAASLHTLEFWCESALQIVDRTHMFAESLFEESEYYLSMALKNITDVRFEEDKIFEVIRAALNERMEHIDILDRLAEMGVNFDRLQDEEGMPLLWKVVSEKYGWDMMDPVKYIPALSEHGVDINECNDGEQSVFWRFLSKYTYELREGISTSVLGEQEEEAPRGQLEQLADYFEAETFTHRDNEGGMISLAAAGAKKPELMRALIRRGTDLNQSGEGKFAGIVPLHIACYRSYPEMVEMIIRGGADVGAVDYEGHSPAHYAVFKMYKFPRDSAPELLARDSYMEYDKYNHDNDGIWLWEDRKKILDMLPEIDIPDNEGVTPLLELCKSEKGVEICLDYLVARGADINASDSRGNTPLMVYIQNGDIPKLLMNFMQAGADVNHQNNEGNTPLLLAMEKNQFQFAKFLLEEGADAEIKNNEGINALDYAISHQMTNYVRLLERI